MSYKGVCFGNWRSSHLLNGSHLSCVLMPSAKDNTRVSLIIWISSDSIQFIGSVHFCLPYFMNGSHFSVCGKGCRNRGCVLALALFTFSEWFSPLLCAGANRHNQHTNYGANMNILGWHTVYWNAIYGCHPVLSYFLSGSHCRCVWSKECRTKVCVFGNGALHIL